MRKYRFLVLFLSLYTYSLQAGVNLDSLKKIVESYAADTATVRKLISQSNQMTSHDQIATEFLARKALALAQNLGEKNALYWANNNLGNRLLNRSNYVEASDYLLKALRIAEGLNNKEFIARSCNGLGNLFGLQDQGDEALTYYKRALSYYKETNNRPRLEIVFTNMGNIYYGKGAYDRANLNIAEKYFLEARDLQQEMKDTSRLIANLDNLGLVYSDEGKDREALEMLKQSDRLCRALGDNYNLIFSNSYVGRSYNHLERPDSAIPYLNRSLELAKSMNNSMMVADAWLNLGESYSQKKDYQQAWHYTQLYQNLHDSLLTSDNTKKIADAQGKYETEKKQRQIELLELNASHEHLMYTYISWSLIAGSVLLLLLALVMYNRYSIKNKSHRQLSIQNQIIAQKNKDITDSINYAKKIQDAMLPAVIQIQKAFPESFVIYQPKDIVSGDFYWFSESEGKVYIAAVDCTGHGVPGAFMSMIGNDMLHDAVTKKGLSLPGEVLTSLNQQVKNSLKQNHAESGSRDGMDAALCVFDKDLKNMSYAGANRPLYLLRNGQVIISTPTKAAVGGLTDSDQVFETLNFTLQKGDLIYLFTDGFCDQFGGKEGKKFTTKRFRSVLEEIHKNSLQIQEEKLKSVFADWKGSSEQVDDVLVIGIRI